MSEPTDACGIYVSRSSHKCKLERSKILGSPAAGYLGPPQDAGCLRHRSKDDDLADVFAAGPNVRIAGLIFVCFKRRD